MIFFFYKYIKYLFVYLFTYIIYRFEITNTPKEWRNISTTLTLFSYTEKTVKRLLEKFEIFRTKLKDEKILENF